MFQGNDKTKRKVNNMLDFELEAYSALKNEAEKILTSFNATEMKEVEKVIRENKAVLSPVYDIDHSAAMRAVYSLAPSVPLKSIFTRTFKNLKDVRKSLSAGYENMLPWQMYSNAAKEAAKAATNCFMSSTIDKLYKEFVSMYYYEARKLASRIL